MIEPRKLVGPRVKFETDTTLQKAFSQVQRGNYEAALPVLRKYYAKASEKVPPEGFSYYGLCLAQVEQRHREAVRLCRLAIERNEFHGQSYANLARVYLLAGSRRKAVETLEHGLAVVPENPGLLRFREEIGYRRPPAIPFLSRDNVVNVALGKARRKKTQK